MPYSRFLHRHNGTQLVITPYFWTKKHVVFNEPTTFCMATKSLSPGNHSPAPDHTHRHVINIHASSEEETICLP